MELHLKLLIARVEKKKANKPREKTNKQTKSQQVFLVKGHFLTLRVISCLPGSFGRVPGATKKLGLN